LNSDERARLASGRSDEPLIGGSANARRRLATLAAGSAGPRVAANAKDSLERIGEWK
jgi:hypothetical protein